MNICFVPSSVLFCNHEVFLTSRTQKERQRIKRVVKYGGTGIRVIKITIDHEIRFALFCYELLVMQILTTSQENINNNKNIVKVKILSSLYPHILFEKHFLLQGLWRILLMSILRFSWENHTFISSKKIYGNFFSSFCLKYMNSVDDILWFLINWNVLLYLYIYQL